jgi:hypothetical protein
MRTEFEEAEAILTSREMNALTHEEQAVLLQHFGSIEEATSYRSFLLGLQDELLAQDDIPEPNVFIPERVKARMRVMDRERKEQRTLMQKISDVLNHRVQLYKPVVAMAAVVAVAVFIINDHNSAQRNSPADTLYADSTAVKQVNGNDSVIHKE